MDEERDLKSSLESKIVKESPNVRWIDITGLEKAKRNLQTAVILPSKFPSVFKGKVKPPTVILLYGPPGAGKTYLARAVATEANAKLFSISSSDVMSKWMGESER
jgi:vacuolar protein-sorting-associated protein 4